VNRKDQRQLENIRRGEADTAEQVAASQAAIEDSLALLHRTEEVAQKRMTRRRHTKGRGLDRAAREKTRTSRSGADT
jgi:hypothetical protein